MPGKSWNIDWNFDRRAICFNCGRDVAQAIQMLPVATSVTCTSCGAERIYNIHGTFETNCNIKEPERKLKYDVWQFAKQARCPDCGSESEHKVTIDEYKATAVCPNCCFTHLYSFSVVTRGNLSR